LKLEKREKVSTLQKVKNFGPTFFAQRKNFFVQLIFFPPNFFWYFGKGKSFRAHKNFGAKKFTEQKSFFAEQKRLSQKFFVVFFHRQLRNDTLRVANPNWS
jgi:hypothetical protein